MERTNGHSLPRTIEKRLRLRGFWLFLLTAGIISVGATGCSEDEAAPASPGTNTGQTSIRVVHTSHDAPAVDVWVNGTKAISNLAYGASSGYAAVTAGTVNVKVVPAGATSPVVIEANLPIEQNKRYSVLAMNTLANITPVVATDAEAGAKAKVRFIHASPDAPAVDIKLNNGTGAALFANTAFKGVREFIDVDGGTYTLAVTAAGSSKEVVILDKVTLENGKMYTIVAHGTLDGTDSYPFGVRAFIDNGDGKLFADLAAATSQLKVVHASPDAPAVDLYLDGAKVGSNLAFPGNTGYLTIPAGTRSVKVNVAGTTTTAISADLMFEPGKAYSVFAADRVAVITALMLQDNLSMPAPGKAHVRFFHLSPDAPAVDITTKDGTVVFPNVSFKKNTEFLPLNAATYDLQVRLAGTSTVVLDLSGIRLDNGRIYTVFARGLVAGSGNTALNAQIIVNK
ncbi:MAG: DUF4397 domain-containing protein [Ignavibacteria bacterium]|nr:DUF4397 domain-containing protein [Ignavibacteria bacterium]